MDTLIGTEGTYLSGGEQRLVLQRLQISLAVANAQDQSAQCKKQTKAQANRPPPLPLSSIAELSLR